MNNKVNFSIIIPNYNGAYFLADCLNSLKQAIDNCPDSEFEIILIDNNSHDESLKIFETIIPKNFTYRILLNDKNHGFAKSVNQGITKAKYEWVVLLNNDLTMEPTWFQLISENIKKNKNPKVVTFFGTVLTKDGKKFESQGLEFFYSGKAKNISNGKKFLSKETIPKLVWGASAAFIVYNKKILTKIGSFDEDFFAYEEDVDVALRLHNLGYKTLYIPQAISYHLGGGTSNKMGIFRYKMDAKNWYYVIIKNFSTLEIIKNLPKIIRERSINFLVLIRQIIHFYKIKSFLYLPFITLSTYGQVLITIPKMLKKRHQIKILDKLP